MAQFKIANTTPNAIHSRERIQDHQQDLFFTKATGVSPLMSNAGPQIPTEHFQTDYAHPTVNQGAEDRSFMGRAGHHLLGDIHPQRRRAGLSDKIGQPLGPHDL